MTRQQWERLHYPRWLQLKARSLLVSPRGSQGHVGVAPTDRAPPPTPKSVQLCGCRGYFSPGAVPKNHLSPRAGTKRNERGRQPQRKGFDEPFGGFLGALWSHLKYLPLDMFCMLHNDLSDSRMGSDSMLIISIWYCQVACCIVLSVRRPSDSTVLCYWQRLHQVALLHRPVWQTKALDALV